jgi:hypothetical protein
MGKARINCAIIIAEGVYSKDMKPIGPLLESKRYRKSPTTTGGSPIKVFKILSIKPLPGNFFSPVRAPNGRPRIVANIRAVPETSRDNKIIPNNSGSK